MEINLIAETRSAQQNSEILKNCELTKKEMFEDMCGKYAGVCYMKSTYENLNNENREKTIARVNQTKNNGHHSVYDHVFVTLELENVSKALAMTLNNLGWYNTSEKSGRYTQLALSGEKQKIYDKWVEIFKTKIKETYAEKFPNFFTDNKCLKLAQENARYLNSIYEQNVIMVHTVSYRQLNYIHGYIKHEIEKPKHSKFFEKLIPEMKMFCEKLELLPYFDKTLSDHGKKMASFGVSGLNLINNGSKAETHFGPSVYSTSYKGSFAEFAQAERHRTIDYSIDDLPDVREYYIPPIIRSDEKLVKQWLTDIKKNEENVPIGTMVTINEFGTLNHFLLKLYERKCTNAQLEIDNQTNETLNKYYKALKEQKSEMAQVLEKYLKGSRCTFPNYVCSAPCGFADGIKGTRLI